RERDQVRVREAVVADRTDARLHAHAAGVADDLLADLEEGSARAVLLEERNELRRVGTGAVVKGERDVRAGAAAAIDRDASVEQLTEGRARRGARARDDHGRRDCGHENGEPRGAQVGSSDSISRWTDNRSSACASIWRTRSRVSPSVRPISSSDLGSGSPSRPYRSLTTSRSRSGSVSTAVRTAFSARDRKSVV